MGKNLSKNPQCTLLAQRGFTHTYTLTHLMELDKVSRMIPQNQVKTQTSSVWVCMCTFFKNEAPLVT